MRKVLLPAAVLALLAAGVVAAAGGGTSSTPTYYRDVAPILDSKCASCHRLGGIAPFSLATAADAKAHADGIVRLTKAGLMPPWMPGPDSAPIIGRDHRRLTAEQLATLARWSAAGAPAGNPADRHSRPSAGAGLTGPGTTITLQPPRAYVPHAAGGGIDDYHCFLLDPKLRSDMFVTGALIQPQRTGIVHHVILFEASGDNAIEARRLNAASGGRGWTCFGGPGLTETRASTGNLASDRLGSPQWISAWVPGHTTNDLPAGTGVLLHKDAVIVMQVHYNLMHPMKGMRMDDRSKAVLKIVPAAGSSLTPLNTFLAPAPVELPCPAGVKSPLCSRDRAYKDEVRKYGQDAAFISVGLLFLCHKTVVEATGSTTSCDRTFNRAVRIYGVAGHMHLRGVDIRIELNPGTPRAMTLLHIPNWDFHWQDAYYLTQPVDAELGDTVRVTCSFDNSGKRAKIPPRYVLWGEGTTDEMCLGLLQIASR